MKGKKTGGRKKGSPNKHNAALKDMIRQALDTVGGEKYLARQAKQNPTAFMTLLGKTLPLSVGGDSEGGPMKLLIERVLVDAKATD